MGPPAHRSCGGRRRRRRNAHALRLDVEAERHLAVCLGLQEDPDLATPPVEGNAFDFESQTAFPSCEATNSKPYVSLLLTSKHNSENVLQKMLRHFMICNAQTYDPLRDGFVGRTRNAHDLLDADVRDRPE